MTSAEPATASAFITAIDAMDVRWYRLTADMTWNITAEKSRRYAEDSWIGVMEWH